MGSGSGPQRIVACLIGIVAGCTLQLAAAASFPIDVPMEPPTLPQGGELAAPDVEALQHQMGLLSGFGAAGTGWTITPRITLDETLNDNVLQEHAPRRADLVTLVAPGIAVAADTDRLQLRLNYQPTLQVYARTGSQNSLAQQLSMVGTVTLVPDLLFVDVRGLAGVQATYGGLGGVGSIGQPGLGPITANGLSQTTPLGLSRQNLSQSTSFALSPYLLHKFGDTGTLKLGVSLSETATSQLSGFAVLPFASGTDSQRQSSVDETVSFTSGNALDRIQDTVTANAIQSSYSGVGAGSSEQESFDNRVSYAYNQKIAPYFWLGWERMQYSGADRLGLNGPDWGVGSVLTPDSDTRVDVSYGRTDGSTSFRFDGRYDITPRTTLTGSYDSGITTQTGLLLGQLNNAAVSNNGGLVNRNTGGSLFTANNALGVAPGIYRFNTLNLGATAILERDTVSVTLGYSEQTPEGSSHTGISGNARTAGVSWTHLLTPRASLTADASISLGTPSGSIRQNSVVAALSGNYTLSETVSAFARYAFFDRQASEAALSMYQDLFILGLTKQF